MRRLFGVLVVTSAFLLASPQTGGIGTARAQDPAGGQPPQGASAALPEVTGREVKCVDGKATLFDCQNADLLSFLPVNAIGAKRQPTGGIDLILSGLWGWIDSATGREFALVGREDGTAFVEVTDPVNPKYLGELPLHQGSDPSPWRDVKVYKNHAFIVADAAGQHGVQVFDLTQLRSVKQPPAVFSETANYAVVGSVHTLASNEETGFMYAAGSSSGDETCNGGLHMIDVHVPTKPTFAGCYTESKVGTGGTGYVHETQCVVYRGPDKQYQGREICLNSAQTALAISDVTDKKQPKTLSIAGYPDVGMTHQGWLTDDQRYFFLDDEQDGGAGGIHKTRTIVFDVSDLDDPVVATMFYGTTAGPDHNLYIRGRYMYQANYPTGLRIIDIADPKNPKEVGYFVTMPASHAGIGAWTNYPYFKNGVVGVTSAGEGFFLIRPRPQP